MHLGIKVYLKDLERGFRNEKNSFCVFSVVYNILGAAGPKRYDDVYAVKPYCAVFVRPPEEYPTYGVFKVSENKIEVVIKQINGVVVDSYTITEAQ